MVVHDDKLRDQQINYSSSREGLHSSRDSRDPGVAADGVEIRMGREWRAVELLQVMESRLRQRELLRNVTTGRASLGYFPRTGVCKGL